MTAQAHAKRAAALLPIVVPRTGLVHKRDRAERVGIRMPGNRRCSILISSTHLRRRTAALARAIALAMRARKKSEINFLVVLKGAACFGCRLAEEVFRAGGPDVIMHFVSVSSYGKTTHSSGRCKITGRLNMLRGKEVMVVEDICDTGLTLDRLKQRLLKRAGVKSVQTCVLLDKSARCLARLKKRSVVDFIGFQIPAVFVAGYGLDHAERYRELPFIVAIK